MLTPSKHNGTAPLDTASKSGCVSGTTQVRAEQVRSEQQLANPRGRRLHSTALSKAAAPHASPAPAPRGPCRCHSLERQDAVTVDDGGHAVSDGQHRHPAQGAQLRLQRRVVLPADGGTRLRKKRERERDKERGEA